ncbi:MAG: hypothetical protein ISS36_01515 [Candidatus Aenigmarchaeota archaeon]|nr:hypothetical protein [Candidatus Aenigmarchaeota archaeon]
MPEQNTLVSGFNDIIFVAFVVALIIYVGINFTDLQVKMDQTFDVAEVKHIAHLAENCLKGGNDYIDLDDINMENCMFDADLMIITDAITGKEKKEGWNIIGSRSHRIAVNIKAGDDIHPGWLYVEF